MCSPVQGGRDFRFAIVNIHHSFLRTNRGSFVILTRSAPVNVLLVFLLVPGARLSVGHDVNELIGGETQ